MKPTLEQFVPQIESKPWGDEIVIAQTEVYVGKILCMHAGHQGGLQFHRVRDETFYLWMGEAQVTYDDGTGKLVRHNMTAGEAFRVPPGAVHQVLALTECVFFETSSPPMPGDRVNVEAEYLTGDGAAR